MLRTHAKTTPQAATPPPRRRRRGDLGLTTLEWLLIVAAVAGLAALAVVRVQNVVDDTAEQISGSNARVTAARVAAQEITDDTDTAFTEAGADDDKKLEANQDGKAKCDRLAITYGDAFSTSGENPLWQDATNGTTATNKTTTAAGSTASQGCWIK